MLSGSYDFPKKIFFTIFRHFCNQYGLPSEKNFENSAILGCEYSILQTDPIFRGFSKIFAIVMTKMTENDENALEKLKLAKITNYFEYLVKKSRKSESCF